MNSKTAAVLVALLKYNKNHDARGRFASSGGGRAMAPADMPGGGGGPRGGEKAAPSSGGKRLVKTKGKDGKSTTMVAGRNSTRREVPDVARKKTASTSKRNKAASENAVKSAKAKQAAKKRPSVRDNVNDDDHKAIKASGLSDVSGGKRTQYSRFDRESSMANEMAYAKSKGRPVTGPQRLSETIWQMKGGTWAASTEHNSFGSSSYRSVHHGKNFKTAKEAAKALDDYAASVGAKSRGFPK